jgi:hypothetical protein
MNWTDRKIVLGFYEAISRLSKTEKEVGLPSKHLNLVPFDAVPDDIADGLILHFRGSTDDLTDRALAGLLLLKADMDTEHLKGVDVNSKRALQRSLCIMSQGQTRLKKWIDVGARKSVPDEAKFSETSSLVDTAMTEVGALPIVQLFEEAEKEPDPSSYIIGTLQDWVPKPRGFTGIPMTEEDKIGLSRIPDAITRSQEWSNLIRARGRINPSELSSIYSVLMGLVLQTEGLTIEEYAKRSSEIRLKYQHLGIKRVVRPSTVAAEFSQLKDWLVIRSGRVYLGPKTEALLA